MAYFSRAGLLGILFVINAALLAGCDGGGGGDGGSGGAPGCDAMHDDDPGEEETEFVVTNSRSEPVYLTTGGCDQNGWSVDGRRLFGATIPTCEGLLVGDPGADACAPVYEELAAGASVTVKWKRLASEDVPVVDGCDKTEDDSPTCGRMAVVADGTHELKIDAFLEVDPVSGAPSSPLSVSASFDLPAASVPVTIAP